MNLTKAGLFIDIASYLVSFLEIVLADKYDTHTPVAYLYIKGVYLLSKDLTRLYFSHGIFLKSLMKTGRNGQKSVKIFDQKVRGCHPINMGLKAKITNTCNL